MNKNKFARIIPIALTLIIAAVTIAALVSLVRFIFFPGTTTKTTKSDIEVSREALLNTSADRAVSLITRGPIVADEAFRSYQIKVTPTSRNLTVYKGYLNQTVKVIALSNSTSAYDQFVHSLDKANMVKGAELKGDSNDLRGICATGSVYEYQTLKSDTVQKGLWTSTCSGSRGSLNASSEQLNNLFITQIPDARTAISEIWR